MFIRGIMVPTMVFLWLLVSPAPALADACGVIWQPEPWYEYEAEYQATPITNCANPFGANTPVGSRTILLGGQTVADGDGVILPTDSPVMFEYSPFLTAGSGLVQSVVTLFTHEGVDYRSVSLAIDEEDPNALWPLLMLTPATYTVVVSVSEVSLMFGGFDMSPTSPPAISTLTFTISEPPPVLPELLGASSVLFLPGIQASRLYAGEDIAVAGLFNDITKDERIWEPGNNNDVEALRMFTTGASAFPVYTNDILESAQVDIGLGLVLPAGDFYVGLSQEFDRLETEGVIAAWEPYAYDWRYDVATIVADGTRINPDGARRYVTDLFVELASSSFSGRVTIVAHSNGGLLAKALVTELERRNLSDLVDTVVLIGVPQRGTPKAIGTILHGYDQELGQGWVVDALRARRIINNLPGAYGLLPTAAYLAQSPVPVISFDSGPATTDYRERYGDVITTIDEYTDFLVSGISVASTTAARHEPVHVNEALLLDAQLLHEDILARWQAPSNVRVVEIVGIGLPTPVGIRYIDTGQFDCATSFFTQTLECIRALPKPTALLSVFGDQTVMAQSGAAYTGEKETFYVDLNLLSSKDTVEYSHANVTQAPAIQSLITHVVSTTSAIALPEHVFDSLPINTEQVFTVEQIASPVAIATTDTYGRTTGLVKTSLGWEVKREIPGSQYFTLGGVKHLVVPQSDTPRVTTLTGLADGVFTYSVSTLHGNKQQVVLIIANATTTSEMVGQVEIQKGNFGDVLYDYTGDGGIDARQDWTEKYELLQIPVVNEAAAESISDVPVQRPVTKTGTRVAQVARPLVLGAVDERIESAYLRAQLAQIHAALIHLGNILQQLRYNTQ